jgi:ribosome-associated protein
MKDKHVVVEGRGRSAQKRAAKEIEKLAVKLVELSEQGLEKLPVAKQLAEAIELARSTKGHSSRKRQVKHLAATLRKREIERQAIIEFMEHEATKDLRENFLNQHIEQMRDRLCEQSTGPAALKDILVQFPDLDEKKLSKLVHSAQAYHDKKAFREIFRLLKKVVNEHRPGN